jgi:hypothetical protein
MRPCTRTSCNTQGACHPASSPVIKARRSPTRRGLSPPHCDVVGHADQPVRSGFASHRAATGSPQGRLRQQRGRTQTRPALLRSPPIPLTAMMDRLPVRWPNGDTSHVASACGRAVVRVTAGCPRQMAGGPAAMRWLRSCSWQTTYVTGGRRWLCGALSLVLSSRASSASPSAPSAPALEQPHDDRDDQRGPAGD